MKGKKTKNERRLTPVLYARKFAPLICLLLIILIFSIITKGGLFSKVVLKNTFDQCYLYVIGAFGAVFLFSQGSLDLSLGSVIALSSIMGAYTAQKSTALSFIVCIGIGLLIGAINGFIHSELQIMVFVQGLAMSFLIKGFLYILTDRQTVIKVPTAMKTALNRTWIKIAVLMVFAFIVIYLFRYTVLGKRSKAIGAGETAAIQSGINVKFLKRFAFILSGITAGLIAFLLLVKTGNGGPTSGQNYEFSIMVALVLGGMPMEGGAKSNLMSCIYGPLAVAIMNSGMSLAGYSSRMQEIVTGIVFILVLSINMKLAMLTAKKA